MATGEFLERVNRVSISRMSIWAKEMLARIMRKLARKEEPEQEEMAQVLKDIEDPEEP